MEREVAEQKPLFITLGGPKKPGNLSSRYARLNKLRKGRKPLEKAALSG
jgi:hypothetical protein